MRAIFDRDSLSQRTAASVVVRGTTMPKTKKKSKKQLEDVWQYFE